MRKFLTLFVLICMTSFVMASFGLNYKYFQIVDENGDPITSGLKYTVEIVNAGAAATIYYKQNYVSMTEAATDTILNSATTLPASGSLGFYSAPSTYDLKIEDANGIYIRFEDVTARNNVFVWPAIPSGYNNLTVNNLITSTTTISNVIKLTPISYTPTSVSTGTIYMDSTSPYDVWICTGVTGTTSNWGKVKVE